LNAKRHFYELFEKFLRNFLEIFTKFSKNLHEIFDIFFRNPRYPDTVGTLGRESTMLLPPFKAGGVLRAPSATIDRGQHLQSHKRPLGKSRQPCKRLTAFRICSGGSAMAEFSWKWYLKDLKQDKDVNVFSCFSCGGGSTMGYKRAGFRVLGNVEIDKKINLMYVLNHHPEYNYNMDLREFNKLKDLPDELYHLDILDGSPPCTSFSVAGLRDKTWGKVKKFREGQEAQTLDDLFFVFLDTVEKLRPRVVIAENVPGLLIGNARAYFDKIMRRFKAAGYAAQAFIADASRMDVPSKRKRLFIIAHRDAPPRILKLHFDRPVITFGAVRSEHGKPFRNQDAMYLKLLKLSKKGDASIGDVRKRYGCTKETAFNHLILHDEDVAPTICSGGCYLRYFDKTYVSDEDFRNCQTFPQDYDFLDQSVQYACGMSVPPNMMAHIATTVYEQWLS